MSIWNQFELKDRVAIITGGATGLGKAMGQGIAEAGANVVIADINYELAQQTATEFESNTGNEAMACKVDVTNVEDVDKMVQDVVNHFGHIDILFNNAGINEHVKFEDMPYERWVKNMDVNINSMVLVSQAVGKVMIKQQKGSIINTSSMSGIIVNTPQPQAAYNTSKGAVIMFTKSLASEWAQHGIRVNTIAPGYMKTELTKDYFAQGGDMIDTWMKFTPLGRPGVPEELQGAAVYLASDASSFVTGSVLTIDGGYTAL
ncbi:glucose 1-dehydrogenase [Staphylococcus gallinarum]|uniref:Glucose 1-dehydrogenase n=1 Tax=Staphylococcus gallinarum TaxID=1293 RepID=A0A2T4T0V3_STAGA|nr:glucose 1-dehydrogenase [Staphylococcus gallinarum]MCD8821431.1 glucose 1-dehydrogenase [Staphylococcus gallinarum]MCD8826950.1 glucose 1-dehydrogenase [Staphylococcus gallinarum]MCD8871170.1 glucose 1-dehydrogenase [Staphylococcus gallinarum]MCW0985575.1 glucose 1-dehydrogenase [Staphylococcus gallinarum]PTE76148.1 short-chain dehydrogenase [Staphylococcus gallinarum]